MLLGASPIHPILNISTRHPPPIQSTYKNLIIRPPEIYPLPVFTVSGKVNITHSLYLPRCLTPIPPALHKPVTKSYSS